MSYTRNGTVKEILDKCGIKTVVEGVGWGLHKRLFNMIYNQLEGISGKYSLVPFIVAINAE